MVARHVTGVDKPLCRAEVKLIGQLDRVDDFENRKDRINRAAAKSAGFNEMPDSQSPRENLSKLSVDGEMNAAHTVLRLLFR